MPENMLNNLPKLEKGRVEEYTLNQIMQEVRVAIEGVESIEIELTHEAFNLDGQLPEYIESDYFDMASSIKPFLVYAFGKLVEINGQDKNLELFTPEQIGKYSTQFESYKDRPNEFPDPIYLFFYFEKNFKTADEVRTFLEKGLSFQDLATAVCKYSSNDLILLMRKFAANKLDITESEVATRYQKIIREDFEVNEIYIRLSQESVEKNANNVGSFVQLSRAFQNLLRKYQSEKSNFLIQSVFNSLSKGHTKEFLEMTNRIQEIGYIFNISDNIFLCNKAGLNIRELDLENSEYIVNKNFDEFDWSKYSYRTDVDSEDYPGTLDAVVHLSDFAFVNVGGEIKLVSYMSSVRVKVKLDEAYIEKLKKETEGMDDKHRYNYVLRKFIYMEYGYAKLVKQRLLESLRERFQDGLPVLKR